MRVLVIYLFAACVLGAHSQISSTAKQTIDRVTKNLDKLCVKSFGDLIDRVLGSDQKNAVCDLNGRVQSIINPGSGCANALGNRGNITVTLGLALNCSLSAGCQNTQSGVVKDALGLVRCVLSSQNNILESVFTALKNILTGLGDLKVVGTEVQFLLYILGKKLEELACSGSFSLLAITLVLPIVLTIILIGVTVGLIQSNLSVVGYLVLGLLPVVLLLVYIVCGLLVLLALFLSRPVGGILTGLLTGLAGVLQGSKVECPEGAMQLNPAELLKLVKPPSLMDILGVFNTLPSFGGLGSFGGFGNLGGFGGFGGSGNTGGFGNIGAAFG